MSNIEIIKETNLKKTDYRIKGTGRKLESEEYDKAIINFIKETRENEVAITSSEVIELIPSFIKKVMILFIIGLKDLEKNINFQ